MKKTYKMPEALTVLLSTNSIIATSPDVSINTSGSVDAANVEVKESNASDVNVWDEEW